MIKVPTNLPNWGKIWLVFFLTGWSRMIPNCSPGYLIHGIKPTLLINLEMGRNKPVGVPFISGYLKPVDISR